MINFVLYKMIQQGIIDESESIEYEYAIEVIFLKIYSYNNYIFYGFSIKFFSSYINIFFELSLF